MRNYLLVTVAAAGLALSGCDSDDVENAPTNDASEIVNEDSEGYPIAGELSDEQRANYDTFDRDAAMKEYDANHEGIHSGSNDGHSDNDMASDAAANDQASQTGHDASTTDKASNSTSSSNDVARLRARSQMDFAFLDRNGDGQLSVAEYAIWAVRSNPRVPKENDNTRPYTSVEQINEAGETFFYFDADGNTYLSPQEFGAARSSARTPS